MEFKDACKNIEKALPFVVSHLKEEMRNTIMNEEADYEKVRTQYHYLSVLLQRVVNEANA